jgi:hypothetical protein
MAVITMVQNKPELFVPSRPFQPSLMLAGKAGPYPSNTFQALHSWVSSWPTKIWLSWTSLSGTNTLAYNERYGPKSFIKLSPGRVWRHDTQHNDIQHNNTQRNEIQNK